MTEGIQNARDFAIGIVAICGAFLILIIATLSVASAHDVEMCPTALAIALVVAVSVLSPVLAIVSMRASFRIFERSPATGFLYSVLLAIVCTAVAILAAWFFFELTQWWARVVMGPMGSPFQRQCF
ncbi:MULTISPECIES: hypothetical protein [Burkholderia cepacia complex]|uniref:hypothetical protein n=1 Tax=Burkholderia cepacia complex TaxID=87882 RepID=UPI0015916F01|nr:hypothetical protein [Burkholderia cepacia]